MQFVVDFNLVETEVTGGIVGVQVVLGRARPGIRRRRDLIRILAGRRGFINLVGLLDQRGGFVRILDRSNNPVVSQ